MFYKSLFMGLFQYKRTRLRIPGKKCSVLSLGQVDYERKSRNKRVDTGLNRNLLTIAY